MFGLMYVNQICSQTVKVGGGGGGLLLVRKNMPQFWTHLQFFVPLELPRALPTPHYHSPQIPVQIVPPPPPYPLPCYRLWPAVSNALFITDPSFVDGWLFESPVR